MNTLSVRKIAFHGQTGDHRSPESFAFPAAMASMMEYLGEDSGIQIMSAHGVDWLHRGINDDFIAASGIGFALLWDEGLCPSAQDLLQASPYDKGIANAFAWAGWRYDRVTGSSMQTAAVRAIKEGKPFIALGLTDVPEAALICGCDKTGNELYGWSHFQRGMDTMDNGMFIARGWTERTWELIIPKEKVGRAIAPKDILSEGLRIMNQTKVEGYAAGQEAYAQWIAAIENCASRESAIYNYHHALLFNMAEARCWCGEFMKKHGIETGKRFKAIHDLCWKADAVVHSADDLKEESKRATLISVLREIQSEEQTALSEIRARLK